ncbi:MAG: MotA/TolQ/ExbB proton channel family protein [Proteobacteria bacterium]|nr:MotA/TolQ/ExbB proton channel family protein [Pseudomonadota bacterium]
MDKQSIWDILNGALGTMWVLIGFSVLVMTVALERIVAQWKFMSRARALADIVSRCLTRGAVDEGRSACERSRSPLADVFLVGYERLGRVKADNVNSAVHRERVRVLSSLKGPIWLLGTIGATAPFVGLFGTVVGILFGFGDLEAADARGEAGIGVVSGHISEALVATAAGILVAVVAVIIFNFFNQRLARISLELKMLTDEFLEQLHEFGGPESERAQRGTGREDADGDRKAA